MVLYNGARPWRASVKLSDHFKEFVKPKGTVMNMDCEYKAWVKRMTAQGISQGRADLLTKLLTQNIGAVPAKFKRRLQSATIEELDQWGINILHAQTPQEVFSKGPAAPWP
jgi:hypothetical protein